MGLRERLSQTHGASGDTPPPTTPGVYSTVSPEIYHEIKGELHQRLKREWPTLPVLATGVSAEPASMLAALRAGVDDFVDMSAPPTDAINTLRKLLDRQSSLQSRARGCTLALLGARPGVGVTTLAASLSLMLNDQLSQAAAPSHSRNTRRGVALLDLGLPARDGLLYLDTQSGFSFVDGVRNLRRLDQMERNRQRLATGFERDLLRLAFKGAERKRHERDWLRHPVTRHHGIAVLRIRVLAKERADGHHLVGFPMPVRQVERRAIQITVAR